MFQIAFKQQITGVAASAILALCVAAQAPTPASAQRSPQATAQFLSNPAELLAKNPSGGAELVSSVRDLVSGDPATLQPIINLIANANKDQKAAIGAGLAQAAKVIVRTNPGLATEIQQAILNTKDQDVVLAFAAGAGDRPIGAAGGGGGGGGAGGGQTNPLQFGGGGGGGPQPIGGSGTNTPLFSYTSSVTGLGSTFSNSGVVSSSVSP
ncbi:hypothetical protein [Bradyrhizobium embrapense]